MDLVKTIAELRRRRDEVSQAINALERLESPFPIKRRGRPRRRAYGMGETVYAAGSRVQAARGPNGEERWFGRCLKR